MLQQVDPALEAEQVEIAALAVGTWADIAAVPAKPAALVVRSWIEFACVRSDRKVIEIGLPAVALVAAAKSMAESRQAVQRTAVGL